MKFRIAAGASDCNVGNLRTLFVEASQKLFQIDDLTAFITGVLAQPASADELVSQLVREGVTRSSAHRIITQYLRFWSRQGLLEAFFDDVPPAACVHDFAVGGATIAVDFHERALLELALPMLPQTGGRTARAAERFVVAKTGGDVCIAKGNGEALVVRWQEAVPTLKGLLTDAVISNLGTAIALHGALLVGQSGPLLICGAPGAGKTTLALELVAHGFHLHADDIVLLHADGTMEGVGFGSAVKSRSWNLLDHLAARLALQPVHIRTDGRRVRYLPQTAQETPLKAIGTIALLDRRRTASARATSLDPLPVLAKLIAEATNPQQRLSAMQFENLLNIVDDARRIELTYSRLDDGASVLARAHNAD
jgi:hypothetical protein